MVMRGAVPGLVCDLPSPITGLSYEELEPVSRFFDFLLRHGDREPLNRFGDADLSRYPDELQCELAEQLTRGKWRSGNMDPAKIRELFNNLALLADYQASDELEKFYTAAYNRAIEVLAFLALQLPEARSLLRSYHIPDRPAETPGDKPDPGPVRTGRGRGHLHLVRNGK